MFYFCCDQRRREAIRAHPSLNGIDYLEVVDHDAPTPADRQRVLRVVLIKPLSTDALRLANLRIDGGDRIRPILVETAAILRSAPRTLQVTVDRWGDFSTYTLRLVASASADAPPAGFDPVLSAIDFSFKVDCPSEFDCRRDRTCPPVPQTAPEIDYLAKDYASFRQLLIDRMAALMPDWRERNPADLGMALVEVLAYVGDHLSYQQDAIATEAYLGTARRRTSIRRHARLVDYFMHDGCNARVWVQVQVNADTSTPLPAQTRLLTQLQGYGPRLDSGELAQALGQQPIVFETVAESHLYQAHNQLSFYTWGNENCCLPRGATRATLVGTYPNLMPGYVLIFQEIRGAKTGATADADPAHRHAVRLTTVVEIEDPLGGQFQSPANDGPVTVTNITWAVADALPFPFCLCATGTEEHGDHLVEISVALGNIVLADHGHTIEGEVLGPVPESTRSWVPEATGDRCHPPSPVPVEPRFRPRLQEGPLTQTPIDPQPDERKKAIAKLQTSPAAYALQGSLPALYPAITLHESSEVWYPRRDLLNSGPFTRNFVAEVEADGRATLRFGDNQRGLRPPGGTAFTATYRVGNGVAGNIGAGALRHIVTNASAVEGVTNPLPAQGGIDPESIDQVRQNAPYAFRLQERAVTPDDYARMAERHPDVQRAAATFRWTGSWRTVFVTVDRWGGQPVDPDFEQELRQHLERYRLAGYDLEVDGPRYVSLAIAMRVCVQPDYFRSDVKAALLQVFSNRVLPDGRLGVFHPDRFSFGQPVYLSPLYAEAQAVAGVASVQITRFERQGSPTRLYLDRGWLDLGRIEIARLENDPNYPDRGVLQFVMEGGK